MESFPPRSWIADGPITRLTTDEEFGAYLYIAERMESRPFTEDTLAILNAWKANNPDIVNAAPQPPTAVSPVFVKLGDEKAL